METTGERRESRARTDAELLAASTRGDSRAFGELYDRHAAAVFRYGWAQVRHDADAEELLQETFFTAWDRRSRIRLVGDSLLPWLLVTCRNHAANLRRRNARRATVPLIDTDQRAGAPAETGWVMDAIEALGEADRRVCELCLVDGLSYREAAAVLGASPEAVGKRLQRARARLRKAINEND